MLGKNPWDLFHNEKCFLCAGFGRIAIGDNKNAKIPESETCPLCEGKGYLKIKK